MSNTPKQKAIDLVNKFDTIRYNVRNSFAKESALIAVDEILKNIETFNDSVWYLATKDFFEEVKQEIEKLVIN